MKDVHTLKAENKTLTECMNYWSNLALKTFDYLSIPSLRDELCAVATALIGGDYVVPSGGGGGGNESDLRWDGRRPNEPDFAFQRRCFSHAVKYIMAKYSVKQNRGAPDSFSNKGKIHFCKRIIIGIAGFNGLLIIFAFKAIKITS